MSTIEPFLRALIESGGSDLHCKVGSPPRIRIDGRLRTRDTRDLAAADTEQMVREVLRPDLVEEFYRSNTVKAAQKQVRLSLAGALRGVVCQRLVPRADQQGRCVAMKVAINTGRIAEALTDPEKTSTIQQLIREGTFYGMQSFDQHLVSLLRDGVTSLEAAMSASNVPARFHGRAAAARAGRLSGASGGPSTAGWLPRSVANG